METRKICILLLLFTAYIAVTSFVSSQHMQGSAPFLLLVCFISGNKIVDFPLFRSFRKVTPIYKIPFIQNRDSLYENSLEDFFEKHDHS